MNDKRRRKSVLEQTQFAHWNEDETMSSLVSCAVLIQQVLAAHIFFWEKQNKTNRQFIYICLRRHECMSFLRREKQLAEETIGLIKYINQIKEEGKQHIK